MRRLCASSTPAQFVRVDGHRAEDTVMRAIVTESIRCQPAEDAIMSDDVLKSGWSEGRSKWLQCGASRLMQCLLTPFYHKETRDRQSITVGV